jgi:hypothetical protein
MRLHGFASLPYARQLRRGRKAGQGHAPSRDCDFPPWNLSQCLSLRNLWFTLMFVRERRNSVRDKGCIDALMLAP